MKMYDPMIHERVDRYTEQLRSNSEGKVHDTVALKMILHEARKLERERCVTSEERRKSDVKWRFILHQVREAEARGVDLCSIRADLAGKYPFQGMLTEQYMQKIFTAKQELVDHQNLCLAVARQNSNASFANRSLPSSRSSSTSDLVSLER